MAAGCYIAICVTASCVTTVIPDTAATGAVSREGLADASLLSFFGELCADADCPLFVAAAGLLIGAASRAGLAGASVLRFFGELCVDVDCPLSIAAAGLFITHFEAMRSLTIFEDDTAAEAGFGMATIFGSGNTRAYHVGL